jgi:hypothetical protein
MKRITKPRWYVSLFNCVASVYQKTKAWLDPIISCVNCASTIETGVNMF